MDLLMGSPKCIFRGEERYGAQVDMCHFGLVGSGNPTPLILGRPTWLLLP